MTVLFRDVRAACERSLTSTRVPSELSRALIICPASSVERGLSVDQSIMLTIDRMCSKHSCMPPGLEQILS